MSLAAATNTQGASTRGLYEKLEDRILARDQIGASECHYGGRSHDSSRSPRADTERFLGYEGRSRDGRRFSRAMGVASLA